MKKVWKVLLILFLAAIWLNVGYYGGKSWNNANIKFYNNEPLDGFQKFQFSGWKWLCIHDSDSTQIQNDVKERRSVIILLSMVFWPVSLILSLGGWIVYGIVQAIIAVFHAVVWFFVAVFWRGIIVFLFNFLFCGGFFKLLGISSYHWVLVTINLMAAVLLTLWGIKHQRSLESNCSLGLVWVICSTVVFGSCGITLLVCGVMAGWWAFYILWNISLIGSLLLNAFKIEG